MRQEKEIGQLKEITRLQNEEQERQWNKKTQTRTNETGEGNRQIEGNNEITE